VVTFAKLAQDWTRAADGAYKYCIASLDRVLVSQGLQCLDNPCNDNCAWYSLLEAGFGAMYSSYCQVKNTVHIFFMQHKTQFTEHLAGFLQIPSHHRLSWAEQIDTVWSRWTLEQERR